MLSLNTVAAELDTVAPRYGRVSIPTLEPRATVFVVDEDLSEQEWLELRIGSAGWTAEVFSSAREFLDCRRTEGPSCLVLDVNRSDQSGLDLLLQLAQMDEPMPVILITGHADIPMTVRAMKAGAVDVLAKPIAEEDLVRAIDQAIQRSEAGRPHVVERRALRRRYDSLTPRERQVMGLVVSGLLNKQVAGELDISEITVKAHRGQVMRKMAADSFADLVRMAERLQVRPLRPTRQAPPSVFSASPHRMPTRRLRLAACGT